MWSEWQPPRPLCDAAAPLARRRPCIHGRREAHGGLQLGLGAARILKPPRKFSRPGHVGLLMRPERISAWVC